MSSNEVTHASLYFRPDQIVFHVTGQFDSNTTWVNDLQTWANELAKDMKKELVNPGPIVSFPQSIDIPPLSSHTGSKTHMSPSSGMVQQQMSLLERFFSLFRKGPRVRGHPSFRLVTFDVQDIGPNKKPDFQIEPTDEEDPEVQSNNFTILKDLLELVRYLDKNRKSASKTLTVEVISPNWLISVGKPSEPGGTGGPGALPVSASGPSANAGNYGFVLPTGFNSSKSDEEKDVVVAILDTSYKKSKPENSNSVESNLEGLYETWVKNAPNNPHPIVNSLLSNDPLNLGALRDANGNINIHEGYIPADFPPDLEVDGHDYDMTDHGLFVAGIINSIAPQAELHLYKVLNKFGLGDLQGIALAMSDAIHDFKDRKLVINMSLTLNIPLEEEHCGKGDKRGIGQIILDQRPKPVWFWNLIYWICWILEWLFGRQLFSCRGSWFYRQAKPFEWISDLAYVNGTGIIAAAGNNGRNGNRPSALYPAAFDSALGVGALAKGNSIPACYSNLADTPTTSGITTFGGEPGQKNGVLGVYLGNIPDGTPSGKPNLSGWAEWCGTSFAAPIITGLVALALSGGATDTQQAINVVLRSSTTRTNKGEGIIKVDQK